MSSISNNKSSQEGSFYQSAFQGAINMTSSAVSAGASIILPFHFFMTKSFHQVGGLRPQYTDSLMQGVKSAPSIAAIICAQTTAQAIFEKSVNWCSGNPQSSSGFGSMFAGAAFVGFVSAPFLAKFNALTMGLPYKRPNYKEMFAIMGRESNFLLSLRLSGPIAKWAKEQFGDNPVIDYGSTALTGAIGSVCGHPFDTWLTVSQAGKKIKNVRHLFAGAANKAFAVASFALSYRIANETFDKLKGTNGS